ncbi:endonuclease/exonuclease/phosphatase family protein [Necropsobacter massiliensis]|uniref:endonuclease/exonuclease/phosphatase family protein n=1 Tax=Necropsobacter massiliensis TaxID=1400001 RepID=UPI00059630E2|nr:endonuclease/exonuclease/phosphatase family protein [Necropsobacter massiliensis]
MSRIKTVFLALLLLIVAGVAYWFYSIEIYPTPKINFSSAAAMNYRPIALQDNVQCAAATGAVAPIEQNTFGVLVWNIHKGQDQGWQRAVRQFAQGKDFVLLQEVTERQNITGLFSGQFSTALYVTAFAYLGQQSGVNSLSRFTPQIYCAGASVEPWIRIPKVGNAMRFPLADGRHLLTVNLHLVNFELNPTYYYRQLTDMMALIAQHQGPIILAGDFNSWNDRRLALIRRLAAQYQLQQVNFTPDHRLRFFGNPLDWVFVRGFNILQATTLQTSSSDHHPLLLELELLKPQPE